MEATTGWTYYVCTANCIQIVVADFVTWAASEVRNRLSADDYASADASCVTQIVLHAPELSDMPGSASRHSPYMSSN